MTENNNNNDVETDNINLTNKYPTLEARNSKSIDNFRLSKCNNCIIKLENTGVCSCSCKLYKECTYTNYDGLEYSVYKVKDVYKFAYKLEDI